MHPALDGRDAVRVAVDALVVAGVPLHRDVEHLPVIVFVLELADLAEQRILGGVQVLDEIDEAALVLVRDLLLPLGTLVLELDDQALVEEGHGLEAFEHGAGDELDAFGLEDRRVGPERDRRAGRAAALGRLTDDLHLVLRCATVGVDLLVALAVAIDLDQQLGRQRVDDGHADTVQTARHLVPVATELAAGVQHGQHDLGSRLALVLAALERIDRDAATVVGHAAATVGAERDRDAIAVSGHRLVDGVVDDFPDQVMQSGETGRADVHAGTLAHRVEAFEHGDRGGVVVRGGLRSVALRLAGRLRACRPSAGRGGQRRHRSDGRSAW